MNVTDGYQAAIEAVDREVSRLSQMEREAVANGTTLEPLRASWSDLRTRLAHGLAPDSQHGPQATAGTAP